VRRFKIKSGLEAAFFISDAANPDYYEASPPTIEAHQYDLA
jgi:hypothetical protein